MALLPANPGEALWLGGDSGKYHANVGIGGPGGDLDHTDYSQSAIEDGLEVPDYFYLDTNGDVVFKQYVENGRTSENTKYSRTELRELQPNGTSKAAWNSGSGTFSDEAISKIDHVPSEKPWVVFFQVHDADSDFFRVQTEDGAIVCRRSPPGSDEIRTVLATSYTPGAWIPWKWQFDSGRLRIWLNGEVVLDVTGMSKTGCYAKLGCYNQVNNRSDGGSASTGEYCQVTIQRGSLKRVRPGYPASTTPVFTGSTDPGGGPGGGAGNDTQAPTVPENLVGVRGDGEVELSWDASTDNVAVDHYNIYRFSSTGTTGGGGSTSSFGRTTSGTGQTASTADKIVASKATADADGTLTTGHLRAWLDSAGSTSSRMLVYADAAGEPGTLLATSDTTTISDTSESVQDYAFSGADQIAIVSGRSYWIAASWADPGTPSVLFTRSEQSAMRRERGDITYGTFPDPWGTSTGTFTGPIDAWLDTVSGGVTAGETGDIYVSPSGSDSNAGTSADAPLRTLDAALTAASAGDTIIAASGTYPGNFTTTKGGSAGNPITIKSAVRYGATIEGDGSTANEAAVDIEHSYIRLEGFTITGPGGEGSGARIGVLINADNVDVVYNYIHTICQWLTDGTGSLGGAGIDFWQTSTSDVLVDGNIIRNIGLASSTEQLVHGIYCGTLGTNVRLTNNLIYRCEDFGIHCYDTTETDSIEIINNTIAGTGRGILQGPNGITRNNIVYNTDGFAYDIRGTGNTGSDNLYGGTGDGADGGSVGATGPTDPEFVDYALDGSGDFRLSSGSAAIGAGTSTDAPSTDLLGATRPFGGTYDLGAYEFGATPPTGGGTGSGGTTTQLGKITDGASSSASSADKTAVSLVTAAADGTLTGGAARAWLSGSGSATTKLVVYADSAGAPGARLATSDPETITQTTEAEVAYTFSGAGQIAITSGTDYWIGLAWQDPGSVSLNISRDATASGRQEVANYAPDPFGTPSALTGPIDVYIETTTAGDSEAGSFVLLTTVDDAVLTYTDTGLTNGTEYTYAVSAEDAAGNESALSTSVTVIPGEPDTTAPTVPTGLAAAPGDGRLTITWDASTDDDAGMLRYTVYLDAVAFANVDSRVDVATALVAVGLTNGQQYSVTVSATDRSLNESAQSAAVLATPAAESIGGAALLPAQLSGGKVEVSIAWGADLSADEGTWTWTDVTTDVRFAEGITTSLGRNDESETSNPAEVTLVLDNSSGDYSLGSGSANYPYVRRNVPVRVRIDPGSGGGRVVILAFANGFTPSWDARNGQLPVVALSAAGTLRRLAQGSAPLQSAYRRVTEAAAGVVAYWPLEEGRSSTFAYPVRGGSPFTYTGGSPNWAADDSFDCSAALPTLSDAYGQADVTAYTDTGESQVRLLLSIPDDGLPDGTVLMHISMTGTIHRWDLTYGITDGVEVLGLYRYNESDGSLHSSDQMRFDVNGIPGRLSFDWTQQGSDILWTLAFTPASSTGADLTFYYRSTLPSRTAGIVSQFELNPHNASLGATIGHITVENAVTDFFADSDALVAHSGESATSETGRLARLCTENGVPLRRYTGPVTASTDLDLMGPQLVAPLLELLQECELAGQGQLWDGRNAGLSYTTRRRREEGTIKLTVDASAGQLAGDFRPIDDDQRNRNKVTVTRLHGVSYTFEDDDGPLGTGLIGIYDDAITVNTYADGSTVDYAQWFVALGTVEGYRYPSVTVDLAASPELAAAVLDIVPGERMQVTNLDTTLAQFPDATVDLIVEGIAHEITTRTWRVTFRCTPYAPWAVGLGNA